MNSANKKTNTGRSPYAAAMGIHMTAYRRGYAEGEIQLEPFHFNQMGTVHGGTIFSLLDSVGGMAASSYGTMTTASSDTHFFRPVRGLQTLRAVAETVKSGKTLQVIDVSAYDAEDRLAARATITYYRLDADIPPFVPPHDV